MQATSALDATSEKLVQEALDHLMKGRISLVIAHRLSAVQNAHQIAVCSAGKTVDPGTHLEILAKKGQYASVHHYSVLRGSHLSEILSRQAVGYSVTRDLPI